MEGRGRSRDSFHGCIILLCLYKWDLFHNYTSNALPKRNAEYTSNTSKTTLECTYSFTLEKLSSLGEMNLKYVSNIDKSYLYFFHIKNISKYQIQHRKSQKKAKKLEVLLLQHSQYCYTISKEILAHKVIGFQYGW